MIRKPDRTTSTEVTSAGRTEINGTVWLREVAGVEHVMAEPTHVLHEGVLLSQGDVPLGALLAQGEKYPFRRRQPGVTLTFSAYYPLMVRGVRGKG